jgi:hypothetical protein
MGRCGVDRRCSPPAPVFFSTTSPRARPPPSPRSSTTRAGDRRPSAQQLVPFSRVPLQDRRRLPRAGPEPSTPVTAASDRQPVATATSTTPIVTFLQHCAARDRVFVPGTCRTARTQLDGPMAHRAETHLSIPPWCSAKFGRDASLRICFARRSSFAFWLGRVGNARHGRHVVGTSARRRGRRRRFNDPPFSTGQRCGCSSAQLGAEHVLLGDYPYPLGEAEAGALIRTSPLLTGVRARLLAGNAATYLGAGCCMTVAVDLSERAPASTLPTPPRRGAQASACRPAPGGRPGPLPRGQLARSLQPHTVRDPRRGLRAWAELGVRGHVEGEQPWKRARAAGPAGRAPKDVAMNSLTVNLHLRWLASTGRQCAARRHRGQRVPLRLSAECAAGSLRLRPQTVIRLRPRPQRRHPAHQDVLRGARRPGRAAPARRGPRPAADGHPDDHRGEQTRVRTVGWDLAHAAATCRSRCQWGVDWAAWCHYKMQLRAWGRGEGVHFRRHLADHAAKLQGGGAPAGDAVRDGATSPTHRHGRRPSGCPTTDPRDGSGLASLRIFDEVGGVGPGNAACGSPAGGVVGRIQAGAARAHPRPAAPRRAIGRRIGAGPPRVCDRLRHEHGVIADARATCRLAPVPAPPDTWRAAKAW